MIKKFIYLILMANLILLVSCGKVSENSIPSYLTLDAEQITEIIKSNSPTNTLTPMIKFSDPQYLLPTEDWVRDKFTKECEKFLFDYNLKFYIEGQNDCDKTSLYCRAVANILNRHGSRTSAGIAVGELSYFKNINSHKINFIIISDKFKQPKIIYFEPQLMKIITLDTDTDVPLSYNL